MCAEADSWLRPQAPPNQPWTQSDPDPWDPLRHIQSELSSSNDFTEMTPLHPTNLLNLGLRLPRVANQQRCLQDNGTATEISFSRKEQEHIQ